MGASANQASSLVISGATMQAAAGPTVPLGIIETTAVIRDGETDQLAIGTYNIVEDNTGSVTVLKIQAVEETASGSNVFKPVDGASLVVLTTEQGSELASANQASSLVISGATMQAAAGPTVPL